MALVLSCECGSQLGDYSLPTPSNDILEAEGVVPDYEDGIRITGQSPQG